MKIENKIRRFLIQGMLIITFFGATNLSLLAQDPPPPPPPGHGAVGNVPGGGAPIDGGTAILLVFGIAYALKKVFTKEINFSVTNFKKGL